MIMKLKELYEKPIERPVNPAVSATKLDKATKQIEISEYVFTDETMSGLYRILAALKDNQPFEHVGIWIDGYYGSGKSHFLKYLDYCISPDTQEEAMERFLQAVKAIDMRDTEHNLDFDYADLLGIANWLKKATIDTCIFNLETSYDNSTDKKKAFLHVFWNEFNAKRGFNKFNLTLAQHLEKPLAEKGVFDQFKQRIREIGADWDDPGEAADLVDNELGMVLDIAAGLAPSLDKESIRERIIKRDTTVSIERFAGEVASWLKDKGKDYRLVLLADEVSQFINKEKDRYLNLQEIVTKLSEACQNQVWVACTAQQDLSEVMDDCNIMEGKDKEGKIKGRFEVTVSLKGTKPEVITQKRILDKKAEVKPVLGEWYAKESPSFDLHFKLPNSYESYRSQEDFVAYYPFVPYQFKLIMQVFNNFLLLGYVAKEVKGNERSIIKVIHSTAKNDKDQELGHFVSFDELYNNMFEEGLQAKGQKAISNAMDMARNYSKPELARRVANVLFMICNINDQDKMVFPASLDNVTTLLVNDLRTPWLTIKQEVEKVLDYFCDNNIIRREQARKGLPETYSFYSEEEMKVASQIKGQVPDNNTQAEVLRDIFFRHFGNPKNKETYMTRSFAVGATIKQRTFLSNSADVVVDFQMDEEYDSAAAITVGNPTNRLVYYVASQYKKDNRLRNAFYWYCQVSRYMAFPALTEENAKIRGEFEKRARELMDTVIAKSFAAILDTCPIVSGVSVVEDPEILNSKGEERYRKALQKHLGNIYTKAGLVNRAEYPHTSEQLRQSILRPVQSYDYGELNSSLTQAEQEVEIYLDKQFAEVNVADVLAKFAKAPYGWDDVCTLYVINELVRRHRRDYLYLNSPEVEASVVASRILTETKKFTLRRAEAIPQDLVNRFVDAWKRIFGKDAFASSDSTQIFRQCKDVKNENSLPACKKTYREVESRYAEYPFVKPLREFIAMLDQWIEIRDNQKFFQSIIDNQEEAAKLADTCKEVLAFVQDQFENYRSLLAFVREIRDNFAFVPAELQAQAEELKGIETQAWPISIRDYIKLRNAVSAALDKQRQELRQQIEKEYNALFDALEQSAEQQGVDKSVLADRKRILQEKTASSNILMLKNNLDTQSFASQQLDLIQAELARKKPQDYPQPGLPGTAHDPGMDQDGQSAGKLGKTRKPCSIELSTRTFVPMRTEKEVDDYLKKIKQQLMDKINDGYEVTVIK